MKNFSAMLDLYMVAKGYQTDTEMASALGVSRQYMHRVRKLGKATDEFCMEIADQIGLERGQVLVARNADRETGAIGEAWKELLGKVAAVGMLAVLGNNVTAISEKAEKTLQNQSITSVKDYRKLGSSLLNQWLTIFKAFFLPVTDATGHRA